MSKKALITGVTGQDGAYLSDLLLKKGYEVFAIRRRVSVDNLTRLKEFYGPGFENETKIKICSGDMTDTPGINSLVARIKPDEIYNLAAQSHVAESFEQPEYTANCDALGTLRMLEAIKTLGLEKKTRFYQASTSELFGQVQEMPQTERTPFYPRSPYGVAKLYSYWITVNYRESYGIFAANGILFNHESPMRGETFVTRKITIALSRIVLGLEKSLAMGNINSKRDWGHAKDYVEAMWRILQQEKAEDFVIATGMQYSVKEFIEAVVKVMGLAIKWEGRGLNEKGIVAAVGRPDPDSGLTPEMIKVKKGDVIIKISPEFFRPAEVETLLGDPAKARKKLGWVPKTKFKDLVKEMMIADLKRAKRDMYLKAGGYR